MKTPKNALGILAMACINGGSCYLLSNGATRDIDQEEISGDWL